MNPTYAYGEYERGGNMAAQIAALVAAGLMLGGCTEGAPAPPPDQSTVTLTTLEGRQHAYQGEPFGRCRGTNLAHEVNPAIPELPPEPQRSAQCAQDQSGRIALVFFTSGPDSENNQVAALLQSGLPEVTEGADHPTIVPIPASKEAQDASNATVSPAGCVDTDQTSSYAAVLADSAMDLRDYNRVIAISDKTPCDVNIAGISDFVHDRYADVYEPRLPGKDLAERLLLLARIATHEDLHLDGLGHEGSVYQAGPDNKPIYLINSSIAGQPQHFDLQAFTSSPAFSYDEYDSNSVMGNVRTLGFADSHLSPYQLQVVRDPSQKIAGIPSAERAITAGPTRFTADDIDAERFATIALEKPLTFPSTELKEPQTFENLVVVPSYTNTANVQANQQPSKQVESVTVALGSALNGAAVKGTNAYLARFSRPATTDLAANTFQIDLGGNKTVVITFTPQGVVAYSKATS